jgi:hypothetical protein
MFYERLAAILEDEDDPVSPDILDDVPRKNKPGRSMLFHGPADQDTKGLATQNEPETIRRSRIQLLAATVWAKLGDASAVVEELGPNQLSVKVQDFSWKLSVQDDGRVNLSGFDSGSAQFVGKIPQNDAEHALLKISDNITQLISDDLDQKTQPPEPPVRFGPEEDEDEEDFDDGFEDDEGDEDGQEQNPPAPYGDDLENGPPPEQNATPPDMAAPPPQPGMAPPPQPMGPPPQPGMAPPPQPPPGQAPPFPSASRSRIQFYPSNRGSRMSGLKSSSPPFKIVARADGRNEITTESGEVLDGPFSTRASAQKGYARLTDQLERFSRANRMSTRQASTHYAARRVAVYELERMANELQRIGESLGDDGKKVFLGLAKKMDRIMNTVEQTYP